MVNIGVCVCTRDRKLSIPTGWSKVFVFGLEPVFTLVFDFASVFVPMPVFVFITVFTFLV